MFKKKGLLGYKGFKQQTFLLILMERLKISFKGKNKFGEMKQVVICRPKGSSS
jgi:hypothetical protein